MRWVSVFANKFGAVALVVAVVIRCATVRMLNSDSQRRFFIRRADDLWFLKKYHTYVCNSALLKVT